MLVPSLRGLTKAAQEPSHTGEWSVDSQIPYRGAIGGLGGAALGGGLGYLFADEEDRKRDALIGGGIGGLAGVAGGAYSGHKANQGAQVLVDLLNKMELRKKLQ
jgi:hypothetical protein